MQYIYIIVNLCVDCLLNYNIIMQWNITSCRNIHNWSTLLYDITIWTSRCPVKGYTNHTCRHIWKICSSKVTLNVGKKTCSLKNVSCLTLKQVKVEYWQVKVEYWQVKVEYWQVKLQVKKLLCGFIIIQTQC